MGDVIAFFPNASAFLGGSRYSICSEVGVGIIAPEGVKPAEIEGLFACCFCGFASRIDLHCALSLLTSHEPRVLVIAVQGATSHWMAILTQLFTAVRNFMMVIPVGEIQTLESGSRKRAYS